MTVCISPYIPTRKAMGDIYIRIFLLSFLLFLYYFGEGRCREHGTTTQSEHCPSILHCQLLCFCVDAFAVSEYHQYHLQLVILFTKSQIKLLQSRVVLIAPGDSRGYGYRDLPWYWFYFVDHYLPSLLTDAWTPAEWSVQIWHSLHVQ